MTVERIIKEKGGNVLTVGLQVSLAEIVATLTEKRIGAVVVMERDQIRGIVSERDIVRAIARNGAECLSRPAEDFMTAKVVTCGPEDTIHDVMQMMTAGRFRHLPVLKHDKLAGIVSIGDVVKSRIEEVEREAEQIREYIATA